ncbi:hypothetical protein BDV96DRAFT_386810 [Lophiotrema nucula]|uniref:Uncharacterized protein n=1 Tax=Lophiotrema nucula TaxID=690887 RepID=A0A6A5ZG31_9PLEO|nr:hypothetical protein BDV96DRAFT_386810 [Lophiotrema nucula]
MDRPQNDKATRPRSKSTFSFKSDHSKEQQHPLRESHEEKRRSHLGERSKANPNAAMNEAQPIAAALEKPTLQSLRSFQHNDVNGNPIEEPDLSNPTRSRWERPLDTIRSFEAAIDNEYKRRSHVMRGDSGTEVMSGYASRRSSYYGGVGDQSRYSHAGGGGGYYGSRQAAAARESWADSSYGPPGPPGPSRTRYNRMSSDPGWNRRDNGHGVYPTQGYQQSRDTVNTGGSNGSNSDAAPYSTDPSSENSSIERAMPPMQHKADLGEQYGFNGFGGGPQPILEEYGNGPNQGDGYYQQYQQNPNPPPPVPAKTNAPPANNPNVIKLSGQQGPPPSNGNRPNVLQRNSTDASGGKRKSWLKRRFSKNA